MMNPYSQTFSPKQPPQHIDEVVQLDNNSWWVYRRSMDVSGTLSPKPRIVFFANNRDAVDQWLAKQH